MKCSYRNLLFFVFVSLSCGWAGVWLDQILPPAGSAETPGMGLWLVLPFLTVLLLRGLGGDGWNDVLLRPGIKKNKGWYFLALLIFPAGILLTLLLARLTGWGSLEAFCAGNYFLVGSQLLVAAFLKNFFEEYVWRGYLTGKLLHTSLRDGWLYLIVGLVWGLWHLPYYLFFLPEAVIDSVLPVSRMTFAMIAIVTMIAWSVMYVELYRISGSLWTVVLLHSIEDAFLNHLVIDGHFNMLPGKELLISPVVGMAATLWYLTVGLLLRKYRIKHRSDSGNLQQI